MVAGAAAARLLTPEAEADGFAEARGQDLTDTRNGVPAAAPSR